MPVVLPQVRITITAAGRMAATVDGKPFPASEEGRWTRSQFGALLDAVTEDRTRTVRIEVHETDGSTFTDIIRPARTHAQTPESDSNTAGELTGTRQKKSKKQRSRLVEATGEGFIPGENITAALVVATTEASPDGTARGLIKSNKAKSTAEVVLVGHVSGRIVTRQLP